MVRLAFWLVWNRLEGRCHSGVPCGAMYKGPPMVRQVAPGLAPTGPIDAVTKLIGHFKLLTDITVKEETTDDQSGLRPN